VDVFQLAGSLLAVITYIAFVGAFYYFDRSRYVMTGVYLLIMFGSVEECAYANERYPSAEILLSYSCTLLGLMTLPFVIDFSPRRFFQWMANRPAILGTRSRTSTSVSARS